MPTPLVSRGLRVHRSNRAEVHATLLAAFLRHRAEPVDPITPDTVVVGNRGTERWLSHRLAHELGVCANTRFPFPASVVQQLQRWALGGSPRPECWSADSLHQAVIEHLVQLDSTDRTWAPLADWLGSEPRPPADVADPRILGLARQVTDVLDRLMTFRPEWVTAWDQQLPSRLPDGVAPWLPALWRAVAARLGPGHPADRLRRSVLTLRSEHPAEPPPFPHLHVFGIGSLPPVWLELLGAAALHIPTDLYLLTPSNQFWSDVRRGSADLPSPLTMARDRLASELARVLPPDAPASPERTRPNPTLATFGRIARDFQAVLERLPEGYRDAPHAEAEVFIDPIEDSDASEGPPGTVLQWLQSDILHMRHPADHKARLADFERRRLDPADASFQLHACYGLTRQLEALRDTLLDLFASREELRPRDVVVLCPDIQKVAPLVSAVFDTARSPGAPPSIPARVTDRTVREVNPVAEVLIRLLNMGSLRLDAPSVVDLLALEPVSARFGLTPDDLPEVVALIEASGARWARDADHRAAFDQPSDPLCTWRFGLERLAFGVVMDIPDDAPLVLGVLPEDRAGGVPFELVGRVLDYLAALTRVLDDLTTPRTPVDWVPVLGSVLDRLVAPTTPAGFRIRQVREAVARLEAAALTEHSPPQAPVRLTAEAVATWLERPLAADTGPLGQQTGAVTFCSMLPERGVPARVVCLLGMDDGDFPRTASSLGFDPTATHPRVGDRDPRDEDRFLLLEALLAARETVLIFWTGHDLRTNEVIAPAVPIGELVDVLEASFLPPQGWDSVATHLTIHHPLQAFSPRSLTPGGLAPPPPTIDAHPHRLARTRWTFDRRIEASARLAAARRSAARPFWPADLVLPADSEPDSALFDDLLRFWRQPLAWLVERELGLWLRDETLSIPEREPLELDPLDAYGLKRDLAAVAFEDPDTGTEQVHRVRTARGLLPPGTLGRIATSEAQEPVRAAAQLLQPHRSPGAPERIDVDLGGGRSLSGSVPDVASGTLTRLVIGSKDGRKLLEPWLSAVALTASGRPTRAVVAWTGSSSGKPGIVALRPFQGDRSRARDYIVQLTHWMHTGRQRPLPYGPRSSWAFVTKKVGRRGPLVGMVEDLSTLDDKALQGASAAAAQHWNGSDRLQGDRDHPAVRQVFDDHCPILDEDGVAAEAFVELARGVWRPLLDAEEAP